jgi:hypothetical protein
VPAKQFGHRGVRCDGGGRTLPGTNINNGQPHQAPTGGEQSGRARSRSQSIVVPSAGTKFVYLHRTVAGARSMSRVVPTAADTNEPVANGSPDSFTITPALQTPRHLRQPDPRAPVARAAATIPARAA